MGLTPDLSLAERALDALEQIEARGLVWGLVDNALSDDEVTDALRAVIDDPKNEQFRKDPSCTVVTARDLRGLLVDLNMLFQVPAQSSGTSTGWRTRMAEGVRLIAQLRQLFPKHDDRKEPAGAKWASAATLVADYRFLRRPRRYPRRDQEPGMVRAALADVISEPGLSSALEHWLGRMDPGAGLSRFQVEATRRLLQSLQHRSLTGTLVSAGTGSGKTLAFYLPALSWLAHQRAQQPQSRGVRVLALYPRNELLKDQLAEVYDQCRTFDAWVARHGGRPLRVGVLYGDTPYTARSAFKDWSGNSQERVCPFFSCPQKGCDGELVLHQRELEKPQPRLVCRSCAQVVPAGLLAFTRREIETDPPDILFSTVEMLNRHISNPLQCHVYGIGRNALRVPDLVLMDEVHLYAGTYGAQVAYLMRRWWAASGRRSSFVGLSATIADGQTFFANLTGLSEQVVQEIKPLVADIVEEGAEYLLALRGDPVSQTSLLSTSIQTLMLGSRLLDPPTTFDKRTRPFFGWRSFAFTDQLDATNRLFMDFLDAEGRDQLGRLNRRRHPEGGLARLRDPLEPAGRRYLAGQDWRVPRAIGHTLSNSMEVARTTAHDKGVSGRSEVVIATSALEVGFDDPGVGLVLQHKAPRNMASFLQRKGRAGRTRHMRPWTVVVLTDYGRDRLAYQAYDQLFDPELPARQLPLSNRYVQRMQAVYALLDELGAITANDAVTGPLWGAMAFPADETELERWPKAAQQQLRQLTRDLPRAQSGPAWDDACREALRRALDLAPPGADQGLKYAGKNWLEHELRRRRLIELLGHLLDDPVRSEHLSARLSDRLSLTREQTDLVMWTQPRPVMLGAIPTAQRRLATGWRAHGVPGADLQARHPLPDFISANLFSDLSLPELRLELPDRLHIQSPQYLPVQQGLGEFAPGRVSRRYDAALWLGVSAEVLEEFMQVDGSVLERDADIEAWYAGEPQRPFFRPNQGQVQAWQALRPTAARLCHAGRTTAGAAEVADTSNAQLVWSSHLQAPRAGKAFALPAHVGITRLFSSVTAHTHAGQSQALVRRYAIGSRAELRMRQGNTSARVSVRWRFLRSGQPTGVGFDIDTDALVLTLSLPPQLYIAIDWGDRRRERAARAARYRYEASEDAAFQEVVPSVFLRGWIAQVFQISALLLARTENLALTQVLDQLARGEHQAQLLGVLQAVFQAPDVQADDEAPDRLRQALEDALRSPDVMSAVRDVARVLVDPIDADWDPWLSLTVRATLGAACLEAIQQACPQVDVESLAVDIEPGLRDDASAAEASEIWISETNPGGNGLIEQVVELLVTQPDAFYRHVEAALGPRDFEWTESQLREMVTWLGGPTPDNALVDGVLSVRQAATSADAQQAFGLLRAELVRRGQSVFHGYAVALSMRLLRPDTPEELDRLLHEIQCHWDELEDRFGIEVDVRVVCALFSENQRIDQAFRSMGLSLPPSGNRRVWRFGVLMGVLWARGHALRSTALPWSNRYSATPINTERLLLEQWITPRPQPIDPNMPNWAEVARDRLVSTSQVVIRVEAAEAGQWLPQVLRAMVVEPVQFDYLNVFARLTGVKRQDHFVEWAFGIPDSP